MSRKQFKDSPALAFIKPQDNVQEQNQEEVYDNTQIITQDNTQQNTPNRIQVNEQYDTQQYTYNNTQQEVHERKGYIRTQGRKGFKKPRINLAFDSEIFLDKIRNQAEQEGKSITQLVNEIMADYLKKCERKNKKS